MSAYKIIMPCLLASVMIGVSGCFPTGGRMYGRGYTGSEKDLNQSDRENIIYRFDIEKGTKSEYSVYTAERIVWDEAVVNSLFVVQEGQTHKRGFTKKAITFPKWIIMVCIILRMVLFDCVG